MPSKRKRRDPSPSPQSSPGLPVEEASSLPSPSPPKRAKHKGGRSDEASRCCFHLPPFPPHPCGSNAPSLAFIRPLLAPKQADNHSLFPLSSSRQSVCALETAFRPSLPVRAGREGGLEGGIVHPARDAGPGGLGMVRGTTVAIIICLPLVSVNLLARTFPLSGEPFEQLGSFPGALRRAWETAETMSLPPAPSDKV